MINRELKSNDYLTKLVVEKGIENWDQLIKYIRHIPYGRNSNRQDLSLVIKENQGSCSSKHALLAKLAKLNTMPHVKLMLGIYKMNQSNTPGIGDELARNALEYLPEAHCYLKIQEEYVDVTSVGSDFLRLKADIIEEIEIEPEQVAEFKVEYHKSYLREWLRSSDLGMPFDQIWSIREKCIENLSA